MEFCYHVNIYINWWKFLGHKGSETSYVKFTLRCMLLVHSKLTHPIKCVLAPLLTHYLLCSVKGGKTGDFSFSASFIVEYKAPAAFHTKQKYYILARQKNIYKFTNQFTN